MKKVLVMCLTLCLIVPVLTGCIDDLFTTAEYRNCKYFAQEHEPGMGKQQVLSKLGCPDGYRDAEGNYHRIKDKKSFQESVSTDTSVEWSYEVYELPDPANPYRLRITFDADGKSVTAKMEVVYGG